MTATVPPTGSRPRNRRKRHARPDHSLRSLARQVASHPRDTAGQLVALGRLLLESKRRVGHGQFAEWFAATGAAYSLRAAKRAMTTARRLSALPLPLGRFRVSAVEILNRRKVIRSPHLIDLLADLVRHPGPPVTYSQARAAVSAQDPAAVYPRAGKGGERETPAEVMARQLADLVYADRDVASVHIVRHDDEDTPSVTVTVIGESAKRRSVTREFLTTALAAAVGEEPMRRCPHPEHNGANPLPASMWNKGAHYCKVCDRRRVKEHDQRKKARKSGGESVSAAGGSAPPTP